MESDRSRGLGCLHTVCEPKSNNSLFYLTFDTHRHNEFSAIQSLKNPLRLKRKTDKLILSCAHWYFPYIEYSRNLPYNKRLVILLQLVNFVSDLGGSLGLWIGMSVLSFAEVLELILLIAFALFVKLRGKPGGRIRSTSQIARKWIFLVYLCEFSAFQSYFNNKMWNEWLWLWKPELSFHFHFDSSLSLIADNFSAFLFSRQTSTSSPNSILGIKTGPSLNTNLHDLAMCTFLSTQFSWAAFFYTDMSVPGWWINFFFKDLSDLGLFNSSNAVHQIRVVLDFASCQY